MNLEALFIVAFGGAFAIFILLTHVPIIKRISKKKAISPRLIICKFLAPFDIGMTVFLIMGSWVGLSTTVLGIGMMTFNVLTGIGLSLGVIFIKKVMVPQWTKEFEKQKNSMFPANIGPTKW